MTQKTRRQTVSCYTCGSTLVRNVRIENPQKCFCDTTCKGEYQRTLKPISKDECVQMYESGMSCVDIGIIVGRDAKSVWSWLKDWGVETRPRGADERQHFKNGHTLGVGRRHTKETREKIRQARIRDKSKGLFLPNGDHVLKGRVGESHPSWKGGVTPLRNAFYASEEWKDACVAVWKKADAKCERCGLDHRLIDRNKLSFHVHHVRSFARYPLLRADPDNLRLLCAPCHRWVHSRKNTENHFIWRDK